MFFETVMRKNEFLCVIDRFLGRITMAAGMGGASRQRLAPVGAPLLSPLSAAVTDASAILFTNNQLFVL